MQKKKSKKVNTQKDNPNIYELYNLRNITTLEYVFRYRRLKGIREKIINFELRFYFF